LTSVRVALPILHFGFGREGLQGCGPEVVDPPAELIQAFGVETVDVAGAGAVEVHESGVEKNLQMLGNGRPGHGEVARELGDGARVLPETVEDGPSVRLSNRVEDARATEV
jgi:hypothetical protein